MKLTIYKSLNLLSLTTGICLGYIINSKYIFQDNNSLMVIKNLNLSNLEFNYLVFITILLKNTGVALLLSIGGYFSGGILTIIVLFANGFYLGTYFTTYNSSNITLFKFSFYFIFHGILEFYAFFLFSNIGYRGYSFIEIYF